MPASILTGANLAFGAAKIKRRTVVREHPT